MPNDAKLGLIVGVGVVLAVAVVFFRKDGISNPAMGGEATASVGTPGQASPPARAGNGRTNGESPVAVVSRRHIVQEGETLFTLAEHYYGDKTKSLVIYQANQDVLKSSEQLTPGMFLVIPNAKAPESLPVVAEEKH